MDRQIKFRGKTSFGQWVYGSYIKDYFKARERYQDAIIYYLPNERRCTAFLDRESIGEFTGLYSVGGVELYEGDIFNTKPARYQVIFKDGQFMAEWLIGYKAALQTIPLYQICDQAILIGNIFDNPELLKL